MENGKKELNLEESNLEEAPVIYAVSKTENGLQFTRRSFIEMAAASAAVVALTGCGGDDAPAAEVPEAVEAPPTNTAVPTDTPIPPTETAVPTDTPIPPTETAAPTDTPVPTDTPEPTATATPMPVVTISVASANIRKGPGVAHPIIRAAFEGETFPVIGRLADGSWFEIIVEDGLIGWIAASVVTFVFLVDAIPVASVIPTPPAVEPTEAPTAIPTEAPTAVPPEPTPFVGSNDPIQPGTQGIEMSIGGETFTLPCGSPLPAGATCVCNCVTGVDTSPGGFICECDVITYYYPN